jgi:hypothetical protein
MNMSTATKSGPAASLEEARVEAAEKLRQIGARRLYEAAAILTLATKQLEGITGDEDPVDLASDSAVLFDALNGARRLVVESAEELEAKRP